MIEIIIAILPVIICGIILWRIVSKMGYAGAWSLLILIPFVNLLPILYLAFSEWPVQTKLRQTQEQLRKISYSVTQIGQEELSYPKNPILPV